DQREKLALADREADAVDGAHAAERFGEVGDREHAHARPCFFFEHDLFPKTGIHFSGSCFNRSFAKLPAMPSGNSSTSARRIAPSMARQYSVWRITVSCSTV